MVKKQAKCHSFTHQMLSEHLLCARPWGYKDEPKTWPISSAGGVYSLVAGETKNQQINKMMLAVSTVEKRERRA